MGLTLSQLIEESKESGAYELDVHEVNLAKTEKVFSK